MAPRFNKHHLMYSRVQHEATPNNKWMRNSAGLIFPMLIPVHEKLHREIPFVPTPDLTTGYLIKKAYETHREPLQRVNNYIEAVESVIDLTTLHDSQRRLGELIVNCVRLQIPFIQEGLVDA